MLQWKKGDIFETEASRNFSPEAPYETRYFTVILDDGGEISSCDLNHIAAVDEDMALEYGKTVSGKKSETGFCGIYRYRVIKDDGQTKCIFLDCAGDFRISCYCSKQYCYVFSRSGCGFGTGYIFFSDCIPSGGGKHP